MVNDYLQAEEVEILTVEEMVEKEFGPNHIMNEVARCESTFRQYESDGTVLRGEENPDDIGIFQINTYYWLEKSQELGYDIFTADGNIDMARWIYTYSGVEPWNWSRDCWG